MNLLHLFARLVPSKERLTEADYWLDVSIHVGLILFIGFVVWLL